MYASSPLMPCNGISIWRIIITIILLLLSCHSFIFKHNTNPKSNPNSNPKPNSNPHIHTPRVRINIMSIYYLCKIS